eukprot:2890848-Amphidinium_carterae.1
MAPVCRLHTMGGFANKPSSTSGLAAGLFELKLENVQRVYKCDRITIATPTKLNVLLVAAYHFLDKVRQCRLHRKHAGGKTDNCLKPVQSCTTVLQLRQHIGRNKDKRTDKVLTQ